MLDQVDKQSVENWLTDLEDQGMVMSKSEILFALDEKIHSNIFDPNTFVFRVDLKQVHTRLDKLTYKYRQQVEINDRTVWINCPESQIGVKASPGFRSSTDLEDIITIIETMTLDTNRLRDFLEVTNSIQYLCGLLAEFSTEACTNLGQELECDTRKN
jgi:hypothetical protein